MALDADLWDEVLRIEREHGDGGHQWIIERITDCALDEDEVGARRFLAIRERFAALSSGVRQ